MSKHIKQLQHELEEAKQLDLFKPTQAQAKAQNFKQWFGNSHAVDKAGRPQKMYHTTRSGDFHTFEVGRKTTNSGTFGSWETQRHAIFVTPHRKNSETYGKVGDEFKSGSAVMPLHVSAQNPLDLRDGAQHTFELGDKFKEHGVNPSWLRHFDWGHFDGEEGKHFVEAAKKLGHDSVIFHENDPDTGKQFETWALFHPHQVKSVWNHGTYKSDSGNISEDFFTEDEARAAFKKAYPDGWKMDKNRSGETPWKDGVHSADVIRHFGEDGSKTFIYGNHIPELNQFEIEYSEVHGEHGKGTYTNVLDKLRRHMTVVSDLPGNNSAKGAYKKLGAREDRNGRFILDQKKDITESVDGRPVFYHKTGAKFDQFDTDRGQLGAHFGTFEQASKIPVRKGKPTMISAHLDIKNPLRLKDHGSFGPGFVRKQLMDLGITKEPADYPKQAIIDAGYDGVVYKNEREGEGDSWIAFHPHQIHILTKSKITEETMTKLTLTEAENKKKKAELLESVKGKDLMEATHTLLDSGLFELTESMFDDKLASPFAMDRLYIATHGTDAHRDQLLKDEDAMVRFGVAQRGHLTHLNALASDPHPMVRDQVARRGDEELAKKMSTDPHATVRSSAHNRLHELAADEQKKQAEVAESLKEAPHYERGTEIRLVEDGRFATVKAWFETKKQGVFYVVGFPDGKTDMLQESAVIALNEEEDFRSEHDANAALADSAGSPTSKKYKLKRGERVISGHDSEHEAMHAWKNMGDNKGVKIHCESVVDPSVILEGQSDRERVAKGESIGATHFSNALGDATKFFKQENDGWYMHDGEKWIKGGPHEHAQWKPVPLKEDCENEFGADAMTEQFLANHTYTVTKKVRIRPVDLSDENKRGLWAVPEGTPADAKVHAIDNVREGHYGSHFLHIEHGGDTKIYGGSYGFGKPIPEGSDSHQHVSDLMDQMKKHGLTEDFTIPVDGTGLKLDPVQLDQYDAEKAHANECPFCSGEDHENASDEEHQAAMAYHTQAAKAAPTLAEKHFQSRQYMRHQARLKGLV